MRILLVEPRKVPRAAEIILVRKSNAPKGHETGLPGGVLSLNSDGPDSRRPTRGPTPPNALGRGTTSAPALKPAYRAHTAVTGVFLWASAPSRRVGAGHARKGARLPLAASQALCLPHPMVGKNILP